MRHIAVLASLGFMAGLLFCFFAKQPYKIVYAAVMLISGTVLAISAALAKAKNKSTSIKRGMAALFLLISALAAIYSIIFTALRVDRLTRMYDETVTIEGTVISSEPGFYGSTIVKGTANGVKGRFNLRLREQLDCGTAITAEARIAGLANFEDILYSYPEGIYVNTDNATLISEEEPEGIWLVYSRIMEFRDEIIRKIAFATSENAGALLKAMFCGDTSGIPAEIRLNMNRCGVGHLLAISGFHVSIIAGAVAYFLSKIWVGKAVSIIISEILTASFVVFSGMKTSSIRAYIMLSILLMAYFAKREYDAAAAISVCALIMTASNPFIVVDASFLLSVTGVWGVSTAASAVKKEFRIKNKLLSGMAMSLCAAVVILPISICFFDEVCIVSPITNLIFIPMGSAVLILCTIFAFTSGAGFMLPLIKLAGKICEVMIKLSGWLSGKPIYIPVRFGYIPFVLLCLGLVVFIIHIISADTRKTICSALIAYSAAIVLMTCAYTYDFKNIYFNVTATKSGYLCVIYSGRDCVAISSGGDFSSRLDGIESRNGLLPPSVLITSDRENQTFYRDPISVVALNPDTLTTEGEEGEYIEHCELSFVGLKIAAGSDSITVSGGEKSIAVCNGYSDKAEEDFVVYVFNKSITVKDGEDREVYPGYYANDFLIGRR